MRRIFFDKKLQSEFLRRGYTTLQLLSDEEVECLLGEMYELSPSDNYAPQETFHRTFADSDTDYKRKAAKIIRELFSEKINNILVDYQISSANFIVKPPKCREVPVHRDWTFTKSLNVTTVTVWCSLLDVDVSNGALQMVAGSHKLVQNIETSNTSTFYSDFSESLKEVSTLISLKKGEAVLYDSSIIHWSTSNNLDKPREVAGMLCLPKGTEPVFYFPYGNGFKIFEMANSDFEEHPGTDFWEGSLRTKVLEFVENRNITVSEEEFFKMLENGERIRERIYLSQEIFSPTIWQKVKRWFS